MHEQYVATYVYSYIYICKVHAYILTGSWLCGQIATLILILNMSTCSYLSAFKLSRGTYVATDIAK